MALVAAHAAVAAQNTLAVRRLTVLATRDPLTGLANRTVVAERLTSALADRRGAGRPVAVLYLDLDGFKAVNDTHGHAAGDVLLRELAGRLSRVVRGADTVGRIGGDEFVVLLTGPDADTRAHTVAARLVTVLAGPVVLPDGAAVRVGASVGIAVTRGETSAEQLLSNADEAMYQAKRDRSGSRIRTHLEGEL